jgi:hypothetical protein
MNPGHRGRVFDCEPAVNVGIWERSPQPLPPALAMRNRPIVEICGYRQ